MVRLPKNVTPDTVIISMCFDSVDIGKTCNSNCLEDAVNTSSSEKSIRLECSEDTDTVTVFEGNVFSSDMGITAISKIPLIVYSDKTIKNIKTDIHTTTLNELTLNEILLQQSFSNLTQDQFKSNQIKIDKVTEITHHLKMSPIYEKNYVFTINSMDVQQSKIISILPHATNEFQLLPYYFTKNYRILQFVGLLINHYDDILQFPSIFKFFNQKLLNNFKLDNWNLQSILINIFSKCQEVQNFNMIVWNIFVLLKFSKDNVNMILKKEPSDKGKFYNFLLKLIMFWLNTGQKLKQTFIESRQTKAYFDFIQCKFECVHPTLTLPPLEGNGEDFEKENFNQNIKTNEELEQNITGIQYAKAENILSGCTIKDNYTITEQNFERNVHSNIPPLQNKNEYSYFSPRFGHGYYFSFQKYIPYFENYLMVQFSDFNKCVNRVKNHENECDKNTEHNSDIDSDDEGSDISTQNLKRKKRHARCSGNPITHRLVRKLRSSSSSLQYFQLEYHRSNESKISKEPRLCLRRTNPIKNFYPNLSSIHHKNNGRESLMEIVRKTHAKYRQECNKRIKKPRHEPQSFRKPPKDAACDTDNSNTSLLKLRNICKRHHSMTRPSIDSIGDSDFLTSIDYTEVSKPHSSKSFIDHTLKFSTSSMLRIKPSGTTKTSTYKTTTTDSKIALLNKLIYICSDEGGPLFPDKGEKQKRTRFKVMSPSDREAYERINKLSVRQTQGSNIPPISSIKRIQTICEKSMGSNAQRIVTQRYKTLKVQTNSRRSSSNLESKKCKNTKVVNIKKRYSTHAYVGVEEDSKSVQLESRGIPKKYLKEKYSQSIQETNVPDYDINKEETEIKFNKLFQVPSTSKNILFSLKDSYPYFGMCSMSLIFDNHYSHNAYSLFTQSKIIFTSEVSLLNFSNDLLKLNESTVASVYFNYQIYNISEELAHKCLKNYLRRKCGKYLYRRKYRKNRRYYLLYK